MKNQKKDDLPFIIQLIVLAFQLVFLVLFIVFTLLTLGVFLPDEDKKSKQTVKRPAASKEEQITINLERKHNRIKVVRTRIRELEEMVGIIKKKEQRLLFFARLVIVTFLFSVNLIYLTYEGFNIGKLFDWKSLHFSRESIEVFTNFNAFILLIYSVPAFLFYGTVGKFTAAMKAKTVQILKRKHFPSFSELQALREEEKRLVQEINTLKLRLEVGF